MDFKNQFKMDILARGVGRRKEAVAQVQVITGTGQFLINNIPAQQYLHNNTYSLLSVKAPLNILNSSTINTENVVTNADQNNVVSSTEQNAVSLNLNSVETNSQIINISKDLVSNFSKFDTIVKVKGGGLIGQAEAIKLGLARALCSLTINEIGISQEEIRKQLKDKGYLTQDSRVKERRKYGLKKARKATQYNKR